MTVYELLHRDNKIVFILERKKQTTGNYIKNKIKKVKRKMEYESHFFDCARFMDCFNFQHHVTEMTIDEDINEISINELSFLTIEIGDRQIRLSHPTTPFRLVKKDRRLIVNELKPKFCHQIYNTTIDMLSPSTQEEEELMIEEARRKHNALHDENEMAYRKEWIIKAETMKQFVLKFININTDEDTKIRVHNKQSLNSICIDNPVRRDILPYHVVDFVKQVKQVVYTVNLVK